jgi:hypothetical protein
MTSILPRIVPSSVLTGRAKTAIHKSAAIVGPRTMNCALLIASPLITRASGRCSIAIGDAS